MKYEKKLITQKDVIKRMRVKIKITNKFEGIEKI
jgi:hypothetical protein